jgi:hypothetical protein
VADFDRNDKPDVAIGSVAGGAGNGDIDIFLGNGDTTFTRAGPFKVGVYPGAIAAADLNNDGSPDLAVANTGNGNPGSLSVLIGNGDGTFQSAVTTALASRVVDVTTGDFGGDGFQDIAVSEGSGTVDLFTNQGDGTFGSATPYFAGAAANSLLPADVNQDGALDLVVTAGNVINVLPNTGGTQVQLNSSQNPSVFFQQLNFTAQVASTLSGMPLPTGMLHFILDGTALGDMALSGSGSASVSVNSLGAGSHLLEATYDGDVNFFPRALPSVSQLVNKAGTFTNLVPSSSVVLVGDPLSLNVFVIPATGGTPGGSVNLLDGASALGSPALVAGAAVLPNVSTAQAGLRNFTANYGGDANYLASVSPTAPVAVLATPDFLMSASSDGATVPAGQSANIMLTLFLWPGLQPTGPMTFACTGAPALSSCLANPSSILLSGTSVSTVVTISTTKSSLSIPPRNIHFFPEFYELGWLLFCVIPILTGLSRIRGPRIVPARAILCLLLLCATVVCSCGGGGGGGGTVSGGGGGMSSPGTPPGISSLTLSATVPTASGTVSHQISLSLTVTP